MAKSERRRKRKQHRRRRRKEDRRRRRKENQWSKKEWRRGKARRRKKQSGKKPEYLGVQKNERLALCPATNNCISTSENISDKVHYAPPWNYNGGRKTPVNREVAMTELTNVIKSTKPDKFTPKIVEMKDDYVHVEYESPILGLVDDVEFLFSPGKNSKVEYRSASRKGNFDFDVNRKRKI